MRITLGEKSGVSPEILFIMEIWPGGNSSPIHFYDGDITWIRIKLINYIIQCCMYESNDNSRNENFDYLDRGAF